MGKDINREQVLKFYEIIKKDKKVTEDNYKKLSNIIVNIAKEDLKVDEITVDFAEFNKNHGGYAEEHHICINKKGINHLPLHCLINSVFHEIRHVYQIDNFKFKEFDKLLELPFRPKVVSDSTYAFANEQTVGVNPFGLYVISTDEVDARKYASKMSYKFFNELKDIAKNDKNNFYIKVLIDVFMTLSKKITKREIDKIKFYSRELDSNKYMIKIRAFSYIKDCIKELEQGKNNILSPNISDNVSITKIKTITDFYYDENIEKLLLDKAYASQDPYIMSCSVNSIFAKTSEKVFTDCIEMFINNNNNLKEIQKQLSNWDKNLIEKTFNNLIIKNEKGIVEE